MQVEWPELWKPVDEAERRSLETELRNELVEGHPLHDRDLRIVARRCDQDDVLCSISESGVVAVVHLTWNRETDSRWPCVHIFNDFDAWLKTWTKTEDGKT